MPRVECTVDRALKRKHLPFLAFSSGFSECAVRLLLSLCIGVGAFESVSLSVLATGITSYARVGRKDLSATAAKSTNARTGGTGRGKSGDTRGIGSFAIGIGTPD